MLYNNVSGRYISANIKKWKNKHYSISKKIQHYEKLRNIRIT